MNKLLIIGAGRLGTRVGQQWPGPVEAETLSSNRHLELSTLGFSVRTRQKTGPKVSNVLFAIPPSKSLGNYQDEVKRALSFWDETSQGVFLMISSSAVYEENRGGTVSENSGIGTTSRALTLLQAEKEVLGKKNAGILRLAGLYSSQSGPHLYYASHEEINQRPEGLVNLIHYDDAASLSCKILQSNKAAGLWLGCDGSPLTRKEIAEVYAKSIGIPPCTFKNSQGSLGKKLDNSKTRLQFEWQPQWSSFKKFIGGGE